MMFKHNSHYIPNITHFQDWLAIEHGSALAQSLKQKFEVSGIPCLVILKADGTLITKDGRGAVQSKGPAAVKEWM